MCSQFLDAFLPNLAATVSGVVAGVPLGLWLNRKALAHQDAKRRAESRERARAALTALASTVEENLKTLGETHAAMVSGHIVTGLSLNLSAWEMVRGDVARDLPDLEMRLRLARFFEELGLFAQHLERNVTFTYQNPPDEKSAGGCMAAYRQEHLAKPLEPFAARLIEAAKQVRKGIYEELPKLT